MMAWNPTKEVAVARDAAKALGDATMCIVFWLTPTGEQFGIASYGRTKQLCREAAHLAKHLYAAVESWPVKTMAQETKWNFNSRENEK